MFHLSSTAKLRIELEGLAGKKVPGLIYDKGAVVDGQAGAWVINPKIKGAVSEEFIAGLEGKRAVVNKWGRNLTRRSLELSKKMEGIYWMDNSAVPHGGKAVLRRGMFKSPEAMHSFYWPQLYKEWGMIRTGIEKLISIGNPKRREAIKIARELKLSVRNAKRARWETASHQTQGAQTGRLYTRKMEHIPIKTREVYHGMESSLMQEALRGLAEADFSYQKFRMFSKAAKDPRMSYQGKWLAKVGVKGQPGKFKDVRVLKGDANWDAFVTKMRKEGWSYVDETAKLADSSVNRMGALNGLFVRSDILRDLVMAERAAQAAQAVFGRFMRYWKGTRTFGNPATTFRNFFTNVFVLGPMADINLIDPRNWAFYNQAVKDFGLGMRSKSFAEAMKAGAFDGTFARTELGQKACGRALGGFFGHVKGQAATAGHRVWEAVYQGSTGGILKNLNAAQKQLLWNNPGILYSAFDDIFRYVAFLKKRSQGWSMDDAAKFAQEYLINYKNTNGVMEILRGPIGGAWSGVHAVFGVPFAIFPMKSSNLARKWLQANPFKAQLTMNLTELLTGLSYAESHGIMIKKVDEKGKVVETEEPDWREANKQIAAFRRQLPFYDRLKYVPLDQMGIIQKGFDALEIPSHTRDEDGKLATMRMFNLGYYSLFDWLYGAKLIEELPAETPGEEIGFAERMLSMFAPQRLLGGTPVFNIAVAAATRQDPFTGRRMKPRYRQPYYEVYGAYVLSEILPPLPPWSWYTGTSKLTTIIPKEFWPTPSYHKLVGLTDPLVKVRVDGKIETILGTFFGFRSNNYDIPVLVSNPLKEFDKRMRDADRSLVSDQEESLLAAYDGQDVFGKVVDKADLVNLRLDLIKANGAGDQAKVDRYRDAITRYRRDRIKHGLEYLQTFFGSLRDLPVDVGRIGEQTETPKVGKFDEDRSKPTLYQHYPSEAAELAARKEQTLIGGSSLALEYGIIDKSYESLASFAVVGELVDLRPMIARAKDENTPWQEIWDDYRMLYGTLDVKTPAKGNIGVAEDQNIDMHMVMGLKPRTKTIDVYGLINRIRELNRIWRLYNTMSDNERARQGITEDIPIGE
jgi:hypothetical protein